MAKELYMTFGISGSGKSTYVKDRFEKTEIVSSDKWRELITDDEKNQDCNGDAFHMFHLLIEKRMKYGRTVVADATNLRKKSRRVLLDLAKQYGYDTRIIVFHTSLEDALKRNKTREIPRPEFVLEKQQKTFEAQEDELINNELEFYKDIIHVGY